MDIASNNVLFYFRVLGKPPEEEWPKTDVPIKWNSFEVVNQVKINDICQNICSTAQDLIFVSMPVPIKCFYLLILQFYC